MKQILIIILLVIGYLSYSQESYFVEGKGYYGYVFSKDRSLNGFPSESNRYTLTTENISQAELILKNNINTEYVKSRRQLCSRRALINKITLKKYYRQYVGYLNTNNEVIAYVCLTRKDAVDDIKDLSEDLIMVCDGGCAFWRIYINLQTQQVFDMEVNGES